MRVAVALASAHLLCLAPASRTLAGHTRPSSHAHRCDGGLKRELRRAALAYCPSPKTEPGCDTIREQFIECDDIRVERTDRDDVLVSLCLLCMTDAYVKVHFHREGRAWRLIDWEPYMKDQ